MYYYIHNICHPRGGIIIIGRAILEDLMGVEIYRGNDAVDAAGTANVTGVGERTTGCCVSSSGKGDESGDMA